MNAVSNPLEPKSAKKWSRGKRILVIAGVLAMTLLVAVIGLVWWEKPMTWLTADEFESALQPKAFAGLRAKLKQWTYPLLKDYWANRPRIVIESVLLDLPIETNARLLPRDGFRTAGDRLASWILPAAELGKFRAAAETSAGVETNRALLMCFNKQPTELFSRIYTATSPGRKWDEWHLKFFPKAGSGRVNVSLQLVGERLQDGNAEAKTNFTGACQALIPNDGALLLDLGTTNATAGRTQWLIVHPVLLDANGKPLKH